MKGQLLKIIFKQDRAYLTKDNPMTFEQLGLSPAITRFVSPAYWIIKVEDYLESEKKIICHILSYNIGDTEFGPNQNQLADKLKDLIIVKFRHLDTNGLLKTVSGKSASTPSSITSSDKKKEHFRASPIIKQPIKHTINETFLVPMKHVHFKSGGVSFERIFLGYSKTLEISITNNEIKEEFDAVKNYFANALNCKKIQVTVSIEITDNEVTSLDAKSPEIDRIDSQLIEKVRLDYVKSIIKDKSKVEADKSLFTIDELIDKLEEEDIKLNTFYSDDKGLFEDCLMISNTKHYKHLRFLSSKHSHDTMKLRYVLKPFSFVFLLVGEKNYHIVWETLNTKEATYIWHITKDIRILKQTLLEIEDIINEIKVQGKIAYISSTNDQFTRIYHDYSDSDKGFIKWKGQLQNILT